MTPDPVTVLLLGGPRHGTTVEYDPSRSTISFPSWDPPEARMWDPADPGIADASITRHDYDRTKLVDLDGAVVLLYVDRDRPETIRSLFPGSPLSVVDHRDRHPAYPPPPRRSRPPEWPTR